jgi:hypothetical protein
MQRRLSRMMSAFNRAMPPSALAAAFAIFVMNGEPLQIRANLDRLSERLPTAEGVRNQKVPAGLVRANLGREQLSAAGKLMFASRASETTRG